MTSLKPTTRLARVRRPGLVHHYLIFIGVGCLSIAVVLAGGPLWLSGVIYALIGPLCHWNGTVARRRVEELEQRLPAAQHGL